MTDPMGLSAAGLPGRSLAQWALVDKFNRAMLVCRGPFLFIYAGDAAAEYDLLTLLQAAKTSASPGGQVACTYDATYATRLDEGV